MPNIDVVCPTCDADVEIDGDEIELNGSTLVASCNCDHCHELLIVSIR